MKYIYSKGGRPLGFIDGAWAYHLDGKGVGQVKDGRVYRIDGRYVGEIEGDLLVDKGTHPGDTKNAGNPGWIKAPGHPGDKGSLESLYPDVGAKLFN